MPKVDIGQMKPIPAGDDSLLDSQATAALVVKTREMIGASQKMLALEMGVTPSYLCDLEKAHRRWSLKLFNSAKEALQRLAK